LLETGGVAVDMTRFLDRINERLIYLTTQALDVRSEVTDARISNERSKTV
jgi:hypothetical protein